MLSNNKVESDIYFIGIVASAGNAFQYYINNQNDPDIIWITLLIAFPAIYIIAKWVRKKWRIVIKDRRDYN